MPKILYGTHKQKRVIDSQTGSTQKIITKYHEGHAMSPVLNEFSIKHAVQELSIEQLGQMVKNILEDKTKLETSIGLESVTANGKTYYYLVENYTVIE